MSRTMKKNAQKKIKAHCPNCGPRTQSDVVSEHDHTTFSDDESMWENGTYRILQCRGCERVYFQAATWFSEDDPDSGPKISHWPSQEKRPRPSWMIEFITIDEPLYYIVRETYEAFDAEMRSLTAIGVRTVFDRGSEILGIDPAATFSEKLDELEKRGHIGAQEKTSLSVLTNAGSAAAHRAWRPDNEHLITMFEIIEGFLHRNFFAPRSISKLAASVPKRTKRGAKKKSSKKGP